MPAVRPPLDLTGFHAKLYRAEEHLQVLDTEISKWLNSGRYETFVERGKDSARIGVYALRVGPPPDLTRWAVIFGEGVNCLRSALDHLINAFAVYQAAGDPLPPNISNLSFVIVDDPKVFDDIRNSKRGKLRVFTPSFIDLIESFQPYKRTHPVLPALLSLIRDLSNADKHRLLQVAGAGVVNLRGTFVADIDKGTKIGFINPEPIEHNDVVCVIESTEPDPNLALHSISVEIQIAVWHCLRNGSTNPLGGRSECRTLLKMLIEETRYVIDTFKRAM